MPSAERALCDSGPLIALFDQEDEAHEACRAALDGFGGNFFTTWPALTESFHFLQPASRQALLWELIAAGTLNIIDLLPSETPRMRGLMEKYADLPMDLADASLVVVGERLRLRKVFTLDRRDFRIYRPRHTRFFDIFP